MGPADRRYSRRRGLRVREKDHPRMHDASDGYNPRLKKIDIGAGGRSIRICRSVGIANLLTD